MASLIQNYEIKRSIINNEIIQGDNYVTNFTITGVHPSLANAIRRTCLSSIPVVGFDDTYNDDPTNNKIKINKNISSLHNEFIAHRISLIPVCMYKSGETIKIVADYDEDTSNVEYNFKFPQNLPTFSLNIKNDSATRQKNKVQNPDNNIDVLSNYIVINTENPSDVNRYIIPDYFTGDYILIHRLKPNSTSDEQIDAEEIEIDIELTIGTGYLNARYCPVGTITYEFQKDTPDVINERFDMYMNNLTAQRDQVSTSESEKLPPFKQSDKDQYRNSFMLLDSERIFKKNKFGEPDIVKFCIESVGNLESNQIMYDALTILEIRSTIILNMFQWNDKTSTFAINSNRITKSINSTNGFIEIYIKNEDHTLGNLISSYLKKLFILDKILGEYCTFATYKMPHPLEETITIVVGIDTTKDYLTLFSRYGLPLATNSIDIVVNLIILSINSYLSKIAILKQNWSEITTVKTNSFEIANNPILNKFTYDLRNAFKSLEY
jgi:DNA-directed RNA polymerase subunit L